MGFSELSWRPVSSSLLGLVQGRQALHEHIVLLVARSDRQGLRCFGFRRLAYGYFQKDAENSWKSALLLDSVQGGLMRCSTLWTGDVWNPGKDLQFSSDLNKSKLLVMWSGQTTKQIRSAMTRLYMSCRHGSSHPSRSQCHKCITTFSLRRDTFNLKPSALAIVRVFSPQMETVPEEPLPAKPTSLPIEGAVPKP